MNKSEEHRIRTIAARLSESVNNLRQERYRTIDAEDYHKQRNPANKRNN